jgi:hypothetical protein
MPVAAKPLSRWNANIAERVVSLINPSAEPASYPSPLSLLWMA